MTLISPSTHSKRFPVTSLRFTEYMNHFGSMSVWLSYSGITYGILYVDFIPATSCIHP